MLQIHIVILQCYSLEMIEPADDCDPNLELTDKSTVNKRSTRTKTCPGCKTPHADHYWGPPHKDCEGNPTTMIPSDGEIKVDWPRKVTMANKVMGSTDEKHKSQANEIPQILPDDNLDKEVASLMEKFEEP